MLRTWMVCILMAACSLMAASCAATAPLGNPLAIAEGAQDATQMAQATYIAATQIVADVQADLPSPRLPNLTNQKRLIVDTPTAVVILENNQQIIVMKPKPAANPTR